MSCTKNASEPNPDPEPVGIVVAAIALVAVDAADSNTCELFEISDDGTERVAVVRIAMQRFGMQHELSAFGRGGWRGNRHLAAELVRRPCLAAADALHLGGVQPNTFADSEQFVPFGCGTDGRLNSASQRDSDARTLLHPIYRNKQ